MIFVKNVPQESFKKVVDLYTSYKPLETKNLYPNSMMTTVMIVLPSSSIVDEALRNTDGMKVERAVISVERYNIRQSIVDRRDARRRENEFRSGYMSRELGVVVEENSDGYEADGEAKMKEKGKISVIVKRVPRVMDPPATPMRRVIKGSGLSWANVASGSTLR